MDINDYKGLTNAQIALICANRLAEKSLEMENEEYLIETEQVLKRAMRYKLFLDNE